MKFMNEWECVCARYTVLNIIIIITLEDDRNNIMVAGTQT